MNVFAIAAGVVWAGIGCHAAASIIPQRTVTICMLTSGAPLWIVTRAQTEAAGMFADIGVRTEWHSARRDCQFPSREAILIQLSIDSPAGEFRGALAYSLPYDGVHIKVFYDRIIKAVETPRQAKLLAHVLVHEITHILQGVSRHSDTGVMKARWDERDYIEMAWRRMEFSPEDVELIQLGMDARATRIASAP